VAGVIARVFTQPGPEADIHFRAVNVGI